ATGGFLVFNWPPAKLFMGDAGSTYLGFFLAAGTLSNNMIALPQLAGTLTILALPWYDLVTVVSIRLSQGRSPFHADKQHLAHRLTDQGLSKPAAVRVIHALAISSGALGVAMLTWSDHFSLCALLALLLWLSVAILDITLRLRLRKNA
ncbi:MAG: undecaprenyl/decaprenyl-phosphate alpha-N-acetylglucosaminyl 1-phosphate transferase, partial [Gemmataceae bacterium]